jgi:transposase-like protein
VCLAFLAELRWPDGNVACPTCGSQRVTFLKNQRRWKCYEKHPRPQFSIKVGTIFEDSPLGLEKWLPAVWMIVNDKNGVSSYEIARALGITQKSAWFMMHRIRVAMQRGGFDKFSGDVEVDIHRWLRPLHAHGKARAREGRPRHPWNGRQDGGHGPAGAPRAGRSLPRADQDHLQHPHHDA